MRSATAENVGSMNGVTRPLRANSSQAISTTRMEKIPAPPRNTASRRRAASREISACAAASEAEFSRPAILLFPPLQQPLHEKLIEPVGGKAEEGDGEHHRIHAFISAGRAEIADQITKALLRYDKFGRDQQDEGQSQRGAHAV